MMEKNQQKGSEKKESLKSFVQIHSRDMLLMVYDIMAATVAFFFALWFRFDCNFSEIPQKYLSAWLNFAPIYAIICAVVFLFFRLYQSIWKFASFVELKRILYALFTLALIHTALITVLFCRMPVSYYVIGTAIQFILVTFVRFSYRFISLERSKRSKLTQKEPSSRVMLIGAGFAGQLILRDLMTAVDINERVYCFIDDDRSKHGRYIDGVPIVGGREDILLNVEKYKIEKIYFTIPSATKEQSRDILNICKETNCQLKSLRGLLNSFQKIFR